MATTLSGKEQFFNNNIHQIWKAWADLEGGYGSTTPPFQLPKIKEINKTKQKIEDNPFEKEEERKSCMFV